MNPQRPLQAIGTPPARADGRIPLVIVGNSLAALVAATERADHGLPTTVLHPGGPWGGYFAGVQAGGEHWDVGMVLYEFTSFRTPSETPRLSTYDPARRNDIGRFTRVVEDYITRHQPVRNIAPLQMWTEGGWLPDLLLGNRVEAVAALPCAHAAREELRGALAQSIQSPWHASRKCDWPLDGPTSYEAVSRINHGAVLHEAIFAPFARQVMNRDGDHIAALFHRIPWLPLYWPETLLAALEGRPTPLPPTSYSHPVGRCVADLCTQLQARIHADPLIEVRSERLVRMNPVARGFSLDLSDGSRLHAERVAWAQTPRQALAALGAALPPAVEERLPLTLAMLRVPRAALCRSISVAHIASHRSGLYRVTDRSHCDGDDDGAEVRLVVEAHPERLADCHQIARHALDEPQATTRAILDDLAAMGLLRAGTIASFAHVIRLAGALPLPTPASLAAYAHEREEMIRLAPGLEPMAASAGAYATSLSDQIVQGLKLAHADADGSSTGLRQPLAAARAESACA